MYDRQKAVEYAKKYAFNYNDKYFNYTNFGGDCTNFISQCLLNGNLQMDYSYDGWFYTSPNNHSSSWTSVEEFWNYALKNRSINLINTSIENVEIGDIVQFYSPYLKRHYHSLIITKIMFPISTKNIFVSAHDNNAFNKSLIEYNVNYMRFGKILN